MEIQRAETVKDILERHMGQVVKVHLKSGGEFEGTVTKVGDSLVHLSRLSGMYLDAVVNTQGILAVILEVRGD